MVRFTIASIALAVVFGLLIITATVMGVRFLQQFTPPSSGGVSLGSPPALLLLVGTGGGLLLSVLTGWALLAPLGSTFRRGGFAMVGGFATVILMLFTMPLSRAMGQPGLLLLLGGEVVLLIALYLIRRRLVPE